MKHTVEAIKTISSSADNARTIVSEFCQEAMTETRTRLDRVESIANLSTILDAAQLAIAPTLVPGFAIFTRLCKRSMNITIAGRWLADSMRRACDW
ncbi:hypothetical protein [Burkholderia ubonensis]|uniref:hypothetical protein n=1 Tax=Burkholderia ubonensis TaxID=101571 RepID=UPI001E6113C1|nr:hypothetical protein [Burkholderia ubonensis]